MDKRYIRDNDVQKHRHSISLYAVSEQRPLLCIISVEAKQQTSKKDQDHSIITSQI